MATPGNHFGGQPSFFTDLNSDYFVYFVSDLPVAGTNYAACSGASSGGFNFNRKIRRYDGLFRSRRGRRVVEVSDGMSNTIAVGETLGQIDATKRTDINSWLFATMCRGCSDMPWLQSTSPRHPGLEVLGDSVFAYRAGFASRHPSGVNFCMADGSVRDFSREVDLELFYAACGIADGAL